MQYKHKLRERNAQKVNRTRYKDINNAVVKIYFFLFLIEMFKNTFWFIKTKHFVVN